MIPQTPLRPQAEGPLRRRSRRYPGLVLDLDPPFLTFRRGRGFEVFKLEAGEPRLVVCSPRGCGGCQASGTSDPLASLKLTPFLAMCG